MSNASDVAPVVNDLDASSPLAVLDRDAPSSRSPGSRDPVPDPSTDERASPTDAEPCDYGAIFEHMSSVVLLIDPSTGEIVEANPSACEFYGYTREQLTRMRIMDINTLTPEEVRREMEKARREKCKFFSFEHRLGDGRVTPVEVYSGPVRMGDREVLCSVIHDVSRRVAAELEREELIEKLKQVLAEIDTLRGIIPICASCKKIRDDEGFWQSVEVYISDRSDAQFSHGLCPKCAGELYPDLELPED